MTTTAQTDQKSTLFNLTIKKPEDFVSHILDPFFQIGIEEGEVIKIYTLPTISTDFIVKHKKWQKEWASRQTIVVVLPPKENEVIVLRNLLAECFKEVSKQVASLIDRVRIAFIKQIFSETELVTIAEVPTKTFLCSSPVLTLSPLLINFIVVNSIEDGEKVFSFIKNQMNQEL